jgi:hypothetical protein
VRTLTSVVLLVTLASAAWAESAASTVGEMVYRHGVLPSGKPLRGEREAGVVIEGEMAACVTCHRRSGLGAWEGSSVIPPIIGRYLFRPGAKNVEDLDLPHVQGFTPNRDAYNDVTLARAIRAGIGPDGHQLGYLMPHYDLDDPTMASLIEYLKGLTNDPVPGVSRDTLHFATIITPDADGMRRQGVLDVLNRFFAGKNAGYRGESPPLQASRQYMYRVNRKWELHVWELTGTPDTWEQQLHDRLSAEPVFAVISGLGGRSWAPVHRFCERESVPCLLPNVDLPVVAEADFYSIYFSKGVLLEGELISRRLRESGGRLGLHRAVQVFRKGDIGEDAAKAAGTAIATTGIETVNRALKAGGSGQELVSALADTGAGDAVILWLRPADLASLPPEIGKASEVFMSGLMGGLENSPLPAAWRAVTLMTYPFDLPDLRKVRMNYPLSWFKIEHIPIVAERTQSDTYLACVILAETIGHMLDSFVRDYLVERVEVMLSHRLMNAYYPRLGLAPGQRFASKGGYIVRFAGSEGTRLVADGSWTVP